VTASATGRVSSGESCAQLASSLSLEHQVGQLYMAGIPSTSTTVPADVGALLQKGLVGSVILVGDADSGIDGVARLTGRIAAAGSAGQPVIVAADQEGGMVQRLQGGDFDTIPSALEQGRLPDTTLTGDATVWGGQMQQAGVLFNLAPVADVVPSSLGSANAPIGALRRGFGSDPAVVAEKVTAVVKGFHNAEIATSVKHFPNLGEVTGNTDTRANVVDTVTDADSPALAAFRAGIAAGTQSVMVSNAVYQRIDPDQPATFSEAVISLLRDDLAFSGVIVSDDLGDAAAVSAVPSAQRGLAFLAAGGDLAVVVDGSRVDDMVTATLAKARADEDFASQVTAKAARVLKLKASVGLVTCS
jgi:beta-N-acetylhexosaminidase